MRRLLVSLFLVSTVTISLTACGGGGGSSASADATPATDAQNVTGLPIYPNMTDAVTLPAMGRDDGTYSEYGAKSTDALDGVEGWYRAHLTGATETVKESSFEHGIEFVLPSKDLVDVYNDKTGDAGVVTVKLLKYTGPAT
ncbi:MAG: hypothetical protein M3R30_03775 [Candidatus Eremiobacteraeota bacterium]|nr:hypothetical protein [Candidatus Eremiobacteraeota bacterium]